MKRIKKDSSYRVVHSLWEWLPVTMSWMYGVLESGENNNICVLASKLSETNSNMDIDVIATKGRMRMLVFKMLMKMGVRVISSEYKKAIKKYKPDILHSHFGDRGWLDVAIAKKFNIPQIVSFYGLDVNYLPEKSSAWKLRYRDLFNYASVVLCLGEHMKHNLMNLGCPTEKLIVHHVGVDVEDIRFQPRKIEDNETIKILIASSFREKKGIPFGLRALAVLAKKYPIEISIIGDSDSDPRSHAEKDRILETIAQLKLEDVITLHGFRTHTELLNQAYKYHIFLAPSITAKDGDTEGTPVAIMEMIATGMPVVSTRHSDIPEIIIDKQTGVLAGENNVQELADRIVWMIQNKENWPSMLLNARKHIENEFNQQMQANKLNEIYKHILH